MAACAVDEASLVRPARFAIHNACEADNADELQRLLTLEDEEEFDPLAAQAATCVDRNERDSAGCAPLHVAAINCSTRCFRLLLSAGAKVNLKCNGSPLLHVLFAMAAVPGNADFVSEAVLALLALPAYDIMSVDDLGRSWLHACAVSGAPSLAATVVAALPAALAAHVDLGDKLGRRPLHLAAHYRQQAMLQWLLAQGASAATVDFTGNTPAHAAGRAGWPDGIAILKGTVEGAEASPLAAHPVSEGPTTADVAARCAWLSARNWAGLTPQEELVAACACGEGQLPDAARGEGQRAPRLPDAARGEGQRAAPPRKTLLLTHQDCLSHRTCEPVTRGTARVPPENTVRLDTLLSPVNGTLRTADVAAGCVLDANAPLAAVSEVLRVHEYGYVRRLLAAVGSLSPADDAAGEVAHLDSDTAVSRGSWEAALRAAGAVCSAIDRVATGEYRNAFAAVRPPGHHAGPRGIVTCENDKDGSHGFCLLNNVAIGAAYARAHYGRAEAPYAPPPAPATDGGGSGATSTSAAEGSGGGGGTVNNKGGRPLLRRIAIFDFDVHHGNGTEAVVRALYPSEVVQTVELPFASGAFSTMVYRPWLDTEDAADVMFISSHGYGKRDPASESPFVGWFYPGSGASEGWDSAAAERAAQGALAPTGQEGAGAVPEAAVAGEAAGASAGGAAEEQAARPPVTQHGGRSSITMQPVPVPEPLLERRMRPPHIINVACPHTLQPRAWRRLMTADVLPRLAAFAPDLILVSAGFDAHHKDAINCGYLSLREDDYEWITLQLVKVANACCGGRIVSVLEGGYRVQGRIVSAFGRAVAAHVRALAGGGQHAGGVWDTAREHEQLRAELRAERAHRDALDAAAAAAATGTSAARTGTLALQTPRLPPRDRRLHTSVAAAASVDSPAAVVSEAAAALPASSSAGVALAGGAEAFAPSVSAASASASASASARPSSKRRRGPPVDYAALDQQMREAAGAADAGASAAKAAKTCDGQTAAEVAHAGQGQAAEEGEAAPPAAASEEAAGAEGHAP